jgi:hypothetical protein
LGFVDYLGLGACSAENAGEIDVTGVTVTTTLLTGNSATIKDPKNYILGYITDTAKDKAKDAIAKKNSFLETLNGAAKKAKMFATQLGFVIEGTTSIGFIVDNIDFEVKFKCCQCEEKDGVVVYDWQDKSVSASKTDLFLNLKNPSEIKKLPDMYIGLMVEVAYKVVSKCPKPNKVEE